MEPRNPKKKFRRLLAAVLVSFLLLCGLGIVRVDVTIGHLRLYSKTYLKSSADVQNSGPDAGFNVLITEGKWWQLFFVGRVGYYGFVQVRE